MPVLLLWDGFFIMKREEFLFVVGYDGNTALVDGASAGKYRNLSTLELAGKGLYRPAFCSALYSGDEIEQQQLLAWFREHSPLKCESIGQLAQLFGVSVVPDETVRIRKL